jgi:hypothetical protein
MVAAMREQLVRFRQKFGRDPGPDDPVFFDPEKDTPTAAAIVHELIEARD